MSCLKAMVLKAVQALCTPGQEPPHSPNVTNLFSLASMALMFVGPHEPEIREMAQALGRHCAIKDPKACAEVIAEFNDLRIANHAHKGDDLTSDERQGCDSRAAGFRQSMMVAVQHILPL
jgi:hypothetical protein